MTLVRSRGAFHRGERYRVACGPAGGGTGRPPRGGCMFNRRWLRLLAVLLGLTMLAAACGDDDDDVESGNGDESTDESSDDGGGEGGDFRIGLVYDVGGIGRASWRERVCQSV